MIDINLDIMVQQKQVVGHDEEIGEEKCLPKAWRNAGVSEKKGRFVQMEHNLVQITHYGVPVTPRLH